MVNLVHTLVWTALIQGSLLGALYIFSTAQRSFANRLLGLFLFVFVADGLTNFFPVDRIGGYSLSAYFGIPEVKLFYPTVFFHYVLSKLGRTHIYRRALLTHYALGIAILALSPLNLATFFITGSALTEMMSPSLLESIFLGQQSYAFVFTVIVIILSTKETLRYKSRAEHDYSNLDLINVSWLFQFIFAVIPITLLWGMELTRIFLGGRGWSNIVTVTWLFIVFFIYFLSYKAFRHRTLFENESPAGEPSPPPAESDRRIVDERAKSVADVLEESMQLKRYYRNHNLTVWDLSKALDVPSRTLSESLNRALGTTFSDWVNRHRVEDARRMLRDPAYGHLTIEAIGEDAGFKSRSAMYAAFRKASGHTPGHFRRDQMS